MQNIIPLLTSPTKTSYTYTEVALFDLMPDPINRLVNVE